MWKFKGQITWNVCKKALKINRFLSFQIFKILKMDADPIESVDLRHQPVLDGPFTKGRFDGQVSNQCDVIFWLPNVEKWSTCKTFNSFSSLLLILDFKNDYIHYSIYPTGFSYNSTWKFDTWFIYFLHICFKSRIWKWHSLFSK